MLNKSYDPKEAEARLYNYWETEGYFKCGLTNNQPFSIVIPVSYTHLTLPTTPYV